MNAVRQDSPVTQALKTGPRGSGDFPGYSRCYKLIQQGCGKMALSKSTYLSNDHIDSMADLGSGHEERMKGRMHWMLTYGYIVLP